MNKEFIQRLTVFVEANLANENFSTEDLARDMGMSHSKLHRKLKIIANQTICQFIREVRLKKAKEILLSEDLTVAEISYRVGFASPTYFTKCFHEYFGFAPGELRHRVLENEAEQQVPDSIPKKRKLTPILMALFIGFIFLIPFYFFLIHWVSGSKPSPVKEKSIALLPFKYLSNEPEKQYLVDGMMDAILLHLSRNKKLCVISKTSVEQYARTNKTSRIIGKELNVAYLLDGSFLGNGDEIRMILELITARDNSLLWSHKYELDRKTFFQMQNEVARSIVNEVDSVILEKKK